MTHAGLCDISLMHLIPIGFVTGIKNAAKRYYSDDGADGTQARINTFLLSSGMLLL